MEITNTNARYNAWMLYTTNTERKNYALRVFTFPSREEARRAKAKLEEKLHLTLSDPTPIQEALKQLSDAFSVAKQ